MFPVPSTSLSSDQRLSTLAARKRARCGAFRDFESFSSLHNSAFDKEFQPKSLMAKLAVHFPCKQGVYRERNAFQAVARPGGLRRGRRRPRPRSYLRSGNSDLRPEDRHCADAKQLVRGSKRRVELVVELSPSRWSSRPYGTIEGPIETAVASISLSECTRSPVDRSIDSGQHASHGTPFARASLAGRLRSGTSFECVFRTKVQRASRAAVGDASAHLKHGAQSCPIG